jgi:hypothetical protein
MADLGGAELLEKQPFRRGWQTAPGVGETDAVGRRFDTVADDECLDEALAGSRPSASSALWSAFLSIRCFR